MLLPGCYPAAAHRQHGQLGSPVLLVRMLTLTPVLVAVSTGPDLSALFMVSITMLGLNL